LTSPPLSPSLYKGGGRILEERLRLSLTLLVLHSSLKGEGEEILERGFAPLFPTLPLPLIREGGQGDRLLNNR